MGTLLVAELRDVELLREYVLDRVVDEGEDLLIAFVLELLLIVLLLLLRAEELYIELELLLEDRVALLAVELLLLLLVGFTPTLFLL